MLYSLGSKQGSLCKATFFNLTNKAGISLVTKIASSIRRVPQR